MSSHKIGIFLNLSLALVLTSLGGCSLAPKYQQPKLPIDSHYATSHWQQNKKLPTATMDWNNYFQDPQLRQLITMALSHNRDLKIALLNLEQARAVHNIQFAELFPRANLSAGNGRINSGTAIENNYQVGVSLLSWELDFWGRIKNLKEAALENYLASAAASRAMQLSIIAQVANNYIALRESEATLALAKKNIVNRRKHLDILTKQFQAGTISKITLANSQQSLADASIDLTNVEEQLAKHRHALTLLVGAALPPLATNATFGKENIILHDLWAGLPSDLLTKRPDIIASEHQLKAAGANIGVARVAFLPKISLTSMWGSTSKELDQLLDGDKIQWLFSPQVSLPIFNAGHSYNSLKVAKIKQKIAIANYEKTIQKAFREVSDALANHRNARESLGLQKQKLKTIREQEKLTALRYHAGSISQLELLAAKKDTIAAEQQLVTAHGKLLASRVHLYAALGGGEQNIIIHGNR